MEKNCRENIVLKKPEAGDRYHFSILATFSGIQPSAGDLSTVAVLNGELAGGLWEGEKNGGWAFDIAVNPQLRRKGIGTALCKLALKHAKEKGLEPTPTIATDEGAKLLKRVAKIEKTPAEPAWGPI